MTNIVQLNDIFSCPAYSVNPETRMSTENSYPVSSFLSSIVNTRLSEDVRFRRREEYGRNHDEDNILTTFNTIQINTGRRSGHTTAIKDIVTSNFLYSSLIFCSNMNMLNYTRDLIVDSFERCSIGVDYGGKVSRINGSGNGGGKIIYLAINGTDLISEFSNDVLNAIIIDDASRHTSHVEFHRPLVISFLKNNLSLLYILMG